MSRYRNDYGYKTRLTVTDFVLIVASTTLVAFLCFVFNVSGALELRPLGSGAALFFSAPSSILAGLAYGGFWAFVLPQTPRRLTVAVVTGIVVSAAAYLPVLLILF